MLKINSDYCLNLMKSKEKLEFIISVNYSHIGNFLISSSVFTVIKFSINPNSIGKDLMLVTVFLA